MPVPTGFHTVTPYLLIPQEAAQAVEFYKKAFNAEPMLYMETDDGRVIHAEIRIGDSPVMIGDPTVSGDASVNTEALRPQIHLLLYVDDADAVVKQALGAGATLIAAVEDQSDGDRRGGVQDPFGITWFVATQIKAATREQMQQEFDKQRADRS